MGRAASNEWIDSLSPSGCSPGSGSHRTAETDISSPLGQPRGCRASKEATHGEEVKGAFQEMPREEKEKEGEGQQQGSGEGSRVWKPVLFAGEREDPEEKGEKKSLDGGSCRACILRCRIWGSAYSEEMCGWGKGEVRLTLGMKERQGGNCGDGAGGGEGEGGRNLV